MRRRREGIFFKGGYPSLSRLKKIRHLLDLFSPWFHLSNQQPFYIYAYIFTHTHIHTEKQRFVQGSLLFYHHHHQHHLPRSICCCCYYYNNYKEKEKDIKWLWWYNNILFLGLNLVGECKWPVSWRGDPDGVAAMAVLPFLPFDIIQIWAFFINIFKVQFLFGLGDNRKFFCSILV